jgi:5-methylcytosine-specific restriction endonuclease McrA
MEREFLEDCLRRGLSLAAIGRLAKRHPSTVGYWVARHGLIANGRARHAPRGGIRRSQLEGLLKRGLTSREIAAELDVSLPTVRHWLRRYGLSTARGRELAETQEARRAGAPMVERWCRRHGMIVFPRRQDGAYRCPRCNAEAVVRRRRRVKQILVAEAGGCCAICGYDRYLGALQFHHVDPAGKVFPLSRKGVTRSLAEARSEARKCVLLCANCHAEVEAGIATAPVDPAATVHDSGPR